jgi:superfamily II DNA or RNA helicase
LSDLHLKTAYHKGQDDIAGEFYLPCMSRAVRYDRAVGYFNSTIYIIAWPSLRDFVDRSGIMRVICSPVLAPDDIAAIEEGYSERIEASIAERLREDVRRMLSDPYLHRPARVLATLVSLGVIEVRIAFMAKKGDTHPRHIFHDKLGIFEDEDGHTVTFRGSMNETWSGLSADGNLESIDVNVSWEGGRDAQRVENAKAYFEALWSDQYPTVTVRRFPDIAREELVSAADKEGWPQLLDEICVEMDISRRISADRSPGGRVPRQYQVQALQEWFDRGRRGIFEHATGSGKTFTALCAIRNALERKEGVLVLVPSELLLGQWQEEIQSTLAGLDPQLVLCGAANTRWRSDQLVRAGTRAGPTPRIVIATMQTACSDDFLRQVRQGDELFLVADEVHRIGSPAHRRILSLHAGPRLGLSATPRRAGDPEGTEALLEYFGGIIPPPFTLQDAIRAGALTPYVYHVYTVRLAQGEQEEWDKTTKRIRQHYAQEAQAEQLTLRDDRRLKQWLIERAKIVKTAARKVDLALRVMQENYKPRQHWIVYCDSQLQLHDVTTLLRNNGYSATEYHSAMPGDREQTLRHFEYNGGILVSIRCLDEGVDIPAVSHALILASSKNPREFIQRRGRVLRKAPNKSLAHIHDAIVVPRVVEEDCPSLSIIQSELARALEFGKGSENPSSITELQRIAVRAGLDHERLLGAGYEDDEDAVE